MKGATITNPKISHTSGCFNPRSHEGSDLILNITLYANYVSIHAPMKGATKNQIARLAGYNVSIHAPMKGATDKRTTVRHYFIVSIHRSHEGSDTVPGTRQLWNTCFNPRSHEGSDLCAPIHVSSVLWFQSTLP